MPFGAERGPAANLPTDFEFTAQRKSVYSRTWLRKRTRRRWRSAGGASTEGKGHSWPGSSMPASITTQAVDATDVMWEFFAAHPR